MSALSGTSILATIEEICAFGTRWMGSEGNDKTRDYIARSLGEVGLVAELHPLAPCAAPYVICYRQTPGKNMSANINSSMENNALKDDFIHNKPCG